LATLFKNTFDPLHPVETAGVYQVGPASALSTAAARQARSCGVSFFYTAHKQAFSGFGQVSGKTLKL
jgi:hypothetical protein